MRKLLLVAFAVAFIACVSAENEDRYRSERDERFRPYRSGPDLTVRIFGLQDSNMLSPLTLTFTA